MKTPPPTPPPKPSLNLNWEDWLPYLEASDAPDDIKRQFIETIWAIAMGFVDLGWRIKSSPETCGQDFDLAAALHHAVLNSEEQEKEEV
ncbi:MAG: hypothetical protein AAGA70_09545 [Pseudomonadota bacterium]